MTRGTVTVTPYDADGTWLVTLHGDHDLSTRAALAAQTHAVWPVCRVAIIDLSDAGFVDSGLIRWLLDVERELEAAGAATLSVVEGVPGSVANRIFGLLRMPHVLACYPTREEALAQAPVRGDLAGRR
jgi:ABC-type transporter Mla MlaB component